MASSVTIPNSVTYIEAEAFGNCISLTNATLPSGVTTVRNHLFYQCISLVNVTIPDNVTNIEDWAFFSCSSLTSAPIPNRVTTIAGWAFNNCTALPSVTIPGSVTSIGQGSFGNCSSLTSITIPTSVTTLGQGAFEGCSSLTSITIPASVTNLVDTFVGCTSLAAITVEALNPVYSSVDGVLFNKSQTLLIEYPGGRGGSYTLPYSATSIGDGAFGYCTSLTGVTIPNNVTNIGGGAFGSCSSLTNVTIGNGVATIGWGAFQYCSSLINATVPNNVISIGAYTFNQCYGLRNVILPAGITSIGDHTFNECFSLRSVNIPDGVTTLGDWAFAECTSLTNLIIGNAVTNVGNYAFFYCYSLTNITVGRSVTRLGDWAFAECYGLTNIFFTGNAPSAGLSPFYNISITVYYLPGTTGWGPTFGGCPTALWLPPLSPQAQTAEIGSGAEFRVSAGNGPTLHYQWLFDGTTRLNCTNSVLQLPNLQYSQAGAYTVVVTNAAGGITSPPAFLNVIAPVERRMVPGLNLTGQPGTILNLDFTGALAPTPLWTTFDPVPLVAASRWYFDLSSPLPPQRFYRAWQYTPGAPSTLSLNLVPALTLTGAIGSSLRVDYINQFGPIDAWVTNLATVTLTNTTQLYFDTSAIGQAPRLWRIVPIP